jgi:hypothetical protein
VAVGSPVRNESNQRGEKVGEEGQIDFACRINSNAPLDEHRRRLRVGLAMLQPSLASSRFRSFVVGREERRRGRACASGPQVGLF